MKRFWNSTSKSPDAAALLSNLLDRNGRWIEVADAKSAVVIVFASTYSGIVAVPAVIAWTDIQGSTTVAEGLVACALIGGYAVLCIASALVTMYTLSKAFNALRPRLDRGLRQGLLAFNDIAATDRETWTRAVRELASDELIDQLAEQVHTTALIAASKHEHLQRAIRCLCFSIPLLTVTAIVSIAIAEGLLAS